MENTHQVHHCKQCSYKTKLYFSILQHVRLHRHGTTDNQFSCDKSTPEPYSCEDCDFETDFGNILKKHMSCVHQGHQTCDIHNYSLSSHGCVKCHFRTFSMLVMLKHVINGCRKKAVTSAENFSGKSDKKEIKWHECGQCAYKTRWREDLKTHLLSRHAGLESVERFQCDQCGRKFKYKRNLKYHVKTQHEVVPWEKVMIWFECDQCPYKSNNMSNLRRHKLNKHTSAEEIRWYECDRCSYRSKLRLDLQRHKIIKHTDMENIKWYKCDECTHVSKLKSNLRYHKRTKHGNGYKE